MGPIAVLLALATGASAAPVCKLDGAAWLEGRTRGPAARVVDAKIGETLEVFVVMPGRLDGRRVLFSDDGGRGRVPLSACGPMTVEWRRVEPRMEHVKTPAPNATAKVYANAVVFGPDHGKWIGYDKLEYFETPITTTSEPRLRVRDARPSAETGLTRNPELLPLGTMRLTATVTLGELRARTPGADDAPAGLVSDRVFRYSFRGGDAFLGWLWSWFNVPYLFGSAGKGPKNQAERRLGGDCADVLVAALRRSGRPKMEYSSVAGLVDSLGQVSGPAELRGCREPGSDCTPQRTELRFGKDVRPGDLIALDYIDFDGMPKSWDHIVVVVEDRGEDGKPDGVLGPEDLVADSGDAIGLKLAPLGDQGHVRVEVLRP
jgi:hypothetical protein